MENLKSFVDGLEAKSRENVKQEAGDYIGEDELLYCGKCRTRKQTEIEVPWGKMRPYCLCKCESERVNEERRIEAEKKRAERIEELRRECFANTEMANWTFAHDDGQSEAARIARKYIENFDTIENKGLLMFGGVGTGKSFAAACICNALIDKGIPCLMTNFSRLTNTTTSLYSEDKQKYIESLSKYKVLAIDDLGAERSTEYMAEQVYNIINARYCSGLPLIITTNLSANLLKHPENIENTRIYSRLFEMCIPVEIKGENRRHKKLNNDFTKYKEILGL